MEKQKIPERVRDQVGRCYTPEQAIKQIARFTENESLEFYVVKATLDCKNIHHTSHGMLPSFSVDEDIRASIKLKLSENKKYIGLEGKLERAGDFLNRDFEVSDFILTNYSQSCGEGDYVFSFRCLATDTDYLCDYWGEEKLALYVIPSSSQKCAYYKNNGK
jgi:hypothetical protein